MVQLVAKLMVRFNGLAQSSGCLVSVLEPKNWQDQDHLSHGGCSKGLLADAHQRSQDPSGKTLHVSCRWIPDAARAGREAMQGAIDLLREEALLYLGSSDVGMARSAAV